MITDALLDMLLALWEGMLGLIPGLPTLDFIASPVILSVASDVAAMGSWLPLSAIATVVTVLIASWLAAGGIVIVRMIFSALTGGGGAVSAS